MKQSYYVAPYKTLLRQSGIDGDINSSKVDLTKDQFLALVRNLLSYLPFDEEWYKKTYPDVEHAIASGVAKSARSHYLMNGYFEGRQPGPIKVDEAFYIEKYPDVAEGIEFGDIESAQTHFEQHGFAEGRQPFKI